MKRRVLWDVAMCSPIDRYQHLRGTYRTYIRHVTAITLKMEAECFSEMSLMIYQSKRRHNPKILLLMSMLLAEANRYEFS
jgi:hypothetical protein